MDGCTPWRIMSYFQCCLPLAVHLVLEARSVSFPCFSRLLRCYKQSRFVFAHPHHLPAQTVFLTINNTAADVSRLLNSICSSPSVSRNEQLLNGDGVPPPPTLSTSVMKWRNNMDRSLLFTMTGGRREPRVAGPQISFHYLNRRMYFPDHSSTSHLSPSLQSCT